MDVREEVWGDVTRSMGKMFQRLGVGNRSTIVYVCLALIAGFGIVFLAWQTQPKSIQWSIRDYHTAHVEDDLYECFADIQTSRPLNPSEARSIASSAVRQLALEHPSWEILTDSLEILSENPLRMYFRYRVHE